MKALLNALVIVGLPAAMMAQGPVDVGSAKLEAPATVAATIGA